MLKAIGPMLQVCDICGYQGQEVKLTKADCNCCDDYWYCGCEDGWIDKRALCVSG